MTHYDDNTAVTVEILKETLGVTRGEIKQDTLGVIDEFRKEIKQDTLGVLDEFRKEIKQDTLGVLDEFRKEIKQDTLGVLDEFRKEIKQDTLGVLDEFRKEIKKDTREIVGEMLGEFTEEILLPAVSTIVKDEVQKEIGMAKTELKDYIDTKNAQLRGDLISVMRGDKDRDQTFKTKVTEIFERNKLAKDDEVALLYGLAH